MNFNKCYTGLEGTASRWFFAHAIQKHKSSTHIIICPDIQTQQSWLKELKTLLSNNQLVLQFPAWDVLPLEPLSPQLEISAQRLRTLYHLTTGCDSIIVTTARALQQRVFSKGLLQNLVLPCSIGQKIDKEKFKRQLVASGFKRSSLVESLGQFALRGEVIDIFSALHSKPLRIELAVDTIKSIRLFDPSSQRSIEDLKSGTILVPVKEIAYPQTEEQKRDYGNALKRRALELETPPSELELTTNTLLSCETMPGLELTSFITQKSETLFSYLSKKTSLWFVDPNSLYASFDEFSELIEEHSKRRESDHHLVPKLENLYLRSKEIEKLSSDFSAQSIEPFSSKTAEMISENSSETVQEIITHNNASLTTTLIPSIREGLGYEPLIKFVNQTRDKKHRIIFVVGSNSRAKKLKGILLASDIESHIYENDKVSWFEANSATPISICIGELFDGFSIPKKKLTVITETEVFLSKSSDTAKRASQSIRKLLGTLSQLSEGDCVVHEDYGIGRYHGLTHQSVEGVERDFLHIEYAEGSQLYLPVENITKIQKYIADEGVAPALDKLGGKRWIKTKIKIKQAVATLAGDLIRLYATRQQMKGWRYEPQGALDEEFSTSFLFQETPDQLAAIENVYKDMAGERPMDRLVCGDAGFGKTEVALRGTYKCLQHARQVAFLAPTTILVEQHKDTFQKRFAEHPYVVRSLSRFTSAKENKETLRLLAEGKVDVVVGTHKLLQSSVQFKDLGLLIVDEEHRFGVKHKEHLKQRRKDIDVLTLTATPIPRTLHMALLGIRDISIIATPPQDRRVIRTYIANHSGELIRDAVQREIQRKGQCIYLHNRVQTIETITEELKQLIPEARFDFAHGQMKEGELEKKMHSFIQGDIDVLVCTTIIESGIDIPNCNTIIISRADTFGLAQLYQLRGRVGRSDRQAFAYLLIPELKKVSGDARKRLAALRSLDDLGLGFHLATRDLEIRGAGNLLGKDQSGSVHAVGLELYNKILKETVFELSGKEQDLAETIDPELSLGISSFLPEVYIPDISQRMIMYQRLAGLLSEQEFVNLKAEIVDRFGNPPEQADNFLESMYLRMILRSHGVTKISTSSTAIRLTLVAHGKFDLEFIQELCKRKPKKYRFSKGLTLTTIVEEKERSIIEISQKVKRILCDISRNV